MQPYNPNAKCPKCGSDDIDTVYRQGKQPEDAILQEYSWGEFLRRDCQSCGYAWSEMTLPKAQEERDQKIKKMLEEEVGRARAEGALEALKAAETESAVEEAPVPA